MASTGVKLSYVAPANRAVKVIGMSRFLVAGAQPTIAVQAILGGTTVTISSAAIDGNPQFTVWLAAGDTIQLNVTAVGAAGTQDLTLTCEDYETQ